MKLNHINRTGLAFSLILGLTHLVHIPYLSPSTNLFSLIQLHPCNTLPDSSGPIFLSDIIVPRTLPDIIRPHLTLTFQKPSVPFGKIHPFIPLQQDHINT